MYFDNILFSPPLNKLVNVFVTSVIVTRWYLFSLRHVLLVAWMVSSINLPSNMIVFLIGSIDIMNNLSKKCLALLVLYIFNQQQKNWHSIYHSKRKNWSFSNLLYKKKRKQRTGFTEISSIHTYRFQFVCDRFVPSFISTCCSVCLASSLGWLCIHLYCCQFKRKEKILFRPFLYHNYRS